MRYTNRQRVLSITLAVLLPVLLIVAAPLLAKSKSKSNGNGNSKLSDAAKVAADRGGTEMVDVIVQYDVPPGHSEKVHEASLKAKKKREYEYFKMKALTVPANALHGLAKGKKVRHVSIDVPVTGLSRSARRTARLPELGSPGYIPVAPDITVAVLDSGVGDHADLTGIGGRSAEHQGELRPAKGVGLRRANRGSADRAGVGVYTGG